jgi:hypothetical protein
MSVPNDDQEPSNKGSFCARLRRAFVADGCAVAQQRHRRRAPDCHDNSIATQENSHTTVVNANWLSAWSGVETGYSIPIRRSQRKCDIMAALKVLCCS